MIKKNTFKIFVPKPRKRIHNSKVVKYMGSMSAFHCKNEMATEDQKCIDSGMSIYKSLTLIRI